MIIKMLNELGRRMNTMRTSTEFEDIRKNQTKLKNTTTEKKYIRRNQQYIR